MMKEPHPAIPPRTLFAKMHTAGIGEWMRCAFPECLKRGEGIVPLAIMRPSVRSGVFSPPVRCGKSIWLKYRISGEVRRLQV